MNGAEEQVDYSFDPLEGDEIVFSMLISRSLATEEYLMASRPSTFRQNSYPPLTLGWGQGQEGSNHEDDTPFTMSLF